MEEHACDVNIGGLLLDKSAIDLIDYQQTVELNDEMVETI